MRLQPNGIWMWSCVAQLNGAIDHISACGHTKRAYITELNDFSVGCCRFFVRSSYLPHFYAITFDHIAADFHRVTVIVTTNRLAQREPNEIESYKFKYAQPAASFSDANGVLLRNPGNRNNNRNLISLSLSLLARRSYYPIVDVAPPAHVKQMDTNGHKFDVICVSVYPTSYLRVIYSIFNERQSIPFPWSTERIQCVPHTQYNSWLTMSISIMNETNSK